MRRNALARGSVAIGAAAVLLVCALLAGAAGGAPRWRAIAKAPIEGRIGASTVWTGSEMLVWGGYTRGPGTTITVNRDGAAYDPMTDTWRRMRNAPAGVRGGGGDAAAWTGAAAIVWVGNAPDGPAGGAVYDPADDTWRKLPPGPLGPREGYVSAWTGTELVIIGGTGGDAFASPVAAAVTTDGRWRLLPELNALGALIPSGAVWNGETLVITGWHPLCPDLGSSCPDYENLIAAYDPAIDALRPLDPPSAPALRVVGWTGGEFILIAGQRRTRTFAYDPATDTWRTGSRGPCRDVREGAQVAWLGDRLVQACGDRRLQVYAPAADAWSRFLAGSSIFNRFDGSAIAWTGRRLIAWSGVASRTFNPTPNLGDLIRLRQLRDAERMTPTERAGWH